MLISQPRVHAPGLSPHPPLAQDTLRVDRADLMRLPCLAAILGLVPAAVAACLLQAELCLVFLLPAYRLAVALAAHLVLYLRVLHHRLDAGTTRREE